MTLVDTELCALLAERALAHKAADEYRRGHYWCSEEQTGCGIGCAVKDLIDLGRLSPDLEDDFARHLELSRATGIPHVLLHAVDWVFENLPAQEAYKWPARFFGACKGSLLLVWPRLGCQLLGDRSSLLRRLLGSEDKDVDELQDTLGMYRRWTSTGAPPSFTETKNLMNRIQRKVLFAREAMDADDKLPDGQRGLALGYAWACMDPREARGALGASVALMKNCARKNIDCQTQHGCLAPVRSLCESKDDDEWCKGLSEQFVCSISDKIVEFMGEGGAS